MQEPGIVIVGAGQAGFSAAAKLRNLGYEDSLTIVGDEPFLPYQRPPLSKAFLLGEVDEDRLRLRQPPFFEAQDVSLALGTSVSRIAASEKTVHLGDQMLNYKHLVLATGSTPIRFPDALGGTLSGVHTIRSIADVTNLVPELTADKRLLVIGGGYIGLEAAAVAAKLGLTVTVVEAAPRILNRVACAETSDYFRNLHIENGVVIREGQGIKRLLGDAKVKGAELDNGDRIDADVVILGIGVRPNCDLAESAGLRIDNGIWTDAFGQTSQPGIWAAGDCASFLFQDTRIRLESVGNAIDQAEAVAANILGAQSPYVAKPWFWSDQFDTKLQITGLNMGFDTVVVRTGPNGSPSHWYYNGDRLLAVDAMNDARTYMIAKRLIDRGFSPDKSVVVNPTSDLKSFLSG